MRRRCDGNLLNKVSVGIVDPCRFACAGGHSTFRRVCGARAILAQDLGPGPLSFESLPARSGPGFHPMAELGPTGRHGMFPSNVVQAESHRYREPTEQG